MCENGQGPRRDPKNPKDNKFGHQYEGKASEEGYGICEWCGVRENTKESAQKCLEAVVMVHGNSAPEWYRKRKWLPPDGKM